MRSSPGCAAERPAGDGRCSLLMSVQDQGCSLVPGEHPPDERDDLGGFIDDLEELVGALRDANHAPAGAPEWRPGWEALLDPARA